MTLIDANLLFKVLNLHFLINGLGKGDDFWLRWHWFKPFFIQKEQSLYNQLCML